MKVSYEDFGGKMKLLSICRQKVVQKLEHTHSWVRTVRLVSPAIQIELAVERSLRDSFVGNVVE